MNEQQETDLSTLRFRLDLWITRLESVAHALQVELENQRGDE